jgi:hypothetical protein
MARTADRSLFRAGAVADPQTQWPERFDWKAAGVVMEPTSEELA